MSIMNNSGSGDATEGGWNRFKILSTIGNGSFGTVYVAQDLLCTSEFFEELVAVKAVPLLPLSPSEVTLAMGEVAILQNLRHPHILRYIDCFIDGEQQLCTVTEYVDGGDLAGLIRNYQLSWQQPNSTQRQKVKRFAPTDTLEDKEGNGAGDNVPNTIKIQCNTSSSLFREEAAEEGSHEGHNSNNTLGTMNKTKSYGGVLDNYLDAFVVTDIARQLLEGLQYLHSQNIIHRDIKPANIFITSSGIVKIGDFGVSKLVPCGNPIANTFIGTPHYICPELYMGESYSFPADVWALGVVLYELYTLEPPFEAQNVLALMHVVSEGLYDEDILMNRSYSLRQRQRLAESMNDEYVMKSEGLGRMVGSIVSAMLCIDCDARPSASQLLNIFFAQSSRTSISSICSALSPKKSNCLERSSITSTGVRESFDFLASRTFVEKVSLEPDTPVNVKVATGTIGVEKTLAALGGDIDLCSMGTTLETIGTIDTLDSAVKCARSTRDQAENQLKVRDVTSSLSEVLSRETEDQLIKDVDNVPWLRNNAISVFSRMRLSDLKDQVVVVTEENSEAAAAACDSPKILQFRHPKFKGNQPDNICDQTSSTVISKGDEWFTPKRRRLSYMTTHSSSPLDQRRTLLDSMVLAVDQSGHSCVTEGKHVNAKPFDERLKEQIKKSKETHAENQEYQMRCGMSHYSGSRRTSIESLGIVPTKATLAEHNYKSGFGEILITEDFFRNECIESKSVISRDHPKRRDVSISEEGHDHHHHDQTVKKETIVTWAGECSVLRQSQQGVMTVRRGGPPMSIFTNPEALEKLLREKALEFHRRRHKALAHRRKLMQERDQALSELKRDMNDVQKMNPSSSYLNGNASAAWNSTGNNNNNAMNTNNNSLFSSLYLRPETPSEFGFTQTCNKAYLDATRAKIAESSVSVLGASKAYYSQTLPSDPLNGTVTGTATATGLLFPTPRNLTDKDGDWCNDTIEDIYSTPAARSFLRTHNKLMATTRAIASTFVYRENELYEMNDSEDDEEDPRLFLTVVMVKLNRTVRVKGLRSSSSIYKLSRKVVKALRLDIPSVLTFNGLCVGEEIPIEELLLSFADVSGDKILITDASDWKYVIQHQLKGRPKQPLILICALTNK